MSELDPERARAVFGTWLSALAADPDAAVAASLAYEELGPEARDAWLDAIDEDAPLLFQQGIPSLALYAPLLAVENDEARRQRMMQKLEGARIPPFSIRAWHGASAKEHAAVIISPVYLDFVEVIGGRFTDDDGFIDFIHIPLAHARDPLPDFGLELFPAPAMDVVEELALAVLAHDRSGRPRPSAASALVRYLAPCIS